MCTFVAHAYIWNCSQQAGYDWFSKTEQAGYDGVAI